MHHAESIGDPKADIQSYGKLPNGNMGNVSDSTRAADASAPTATSDAAHWKSLSADSTANITKIDASDGVIAAVAGAVDESAPYSATPSDAAGRPVHAVGLVQTPEVNSNSAAFAVGDMAEQISTGDPNVGVDRQPFALKLPGESASPKVKFTCTTDRAGC